MSAQSEAIRSAAREGYVASLREGRRERAVTIPAKRGKGSYRRSEKHRNREAA